MSTRLLHLFWKLLAVLAVQLLLLNALHLMGYATPLIIACVTLNIERQTPRIPILLWGFATGFLFDIFSNTTGIGMATCTLVAMMQPTLLHWHMPRNAEDEILPSFRSMGTPRYLLYIFSTMLLCHAVFYALDAFTLANWRLTLTAIAVGTLVATLIVAIGEALTQRHKH